MRQANRGYGHQPAGDALAVFEGKICAGVQVRADGEIVVILIGVEMVGEVGQADAELEGQLAIFVAVQRVADKRVERVHLSELLESSQVGLVESESDIGIVVEWLPFLLSVSILVNGNLIGGVMLVETLHLKVVMVEEAIAQRVCLAKLASWKLEAGS